MKVRKAQQSGSKLKYLRAKAKLSSEELAKKAGIHRVTLTNIENGISRPRLETLLSLAEGLGIKFESAEEAATALGLNIEEEEKIDRKKAVTLLRNTLPLVHKWQTPGFDYNNELNKKEKSILKGFYNVRKAGWLDDLTLLSEAGLTPDNNADLYGKAVSIFEGPEEE